MTAAKIELLLSKHADVLERTGRDLAMNFQIPARDIIAWACADMKISRKQWDALQSYRIAKEQAKRDRDLTGNAVPGWGA